MNFNVIKTHSIYGQMDYIKESNSVSVDGDFGPISDEVFESMKENASDINNLRVTATIGDRPHLYVEATEFFTFCEASDMDPKQAASAIITRYSVHNPELDNAEFHVVFPCDSMNKNILGGENLGNDVSNDYAMQLMRGCRRYGLKVNVGKESDYPVVENSSDVMNIREQILSEAKLGLKATNPFKIAKKKAKEIGKAKDKAIDKIGGKISDTKDDVLDTMDDTKKAILNKFKDKKKEDSKNKYKDIEDKNKNKKKK